MITPFPQCTQEDQVPPRAEATPAPQGSWIAKLLPANLFRGQSESTFVQLFRYTFTGGLAFVVDFVALVFLVELCRMHYLVAAALTCGLGLTTNYCLSVFWVFDKRALKNPVTEFTVFVLLGLIGIGLNGILMYSLTELAGLHYLASKIVSTGATFVYNFASKKTILFSA